MSLGVVIKGPEGVVLAADSRITLMATAEGGSTEQPLTVSFDNATKLLTFKAPHNFVGAVTYGMAVIGLRTAQSFVPEFELTLPEQRIGVEEFAQRLGDFYLARWNAAQPPPPPGSTMMFVVGGYDPEVAYGSVFVIELPNNPKPSERNAGDFGMTWGGQLEIATRLIHGFDPLVIPLLAAKLQLDPMRLQQALQELRPKLELKVPYLVLPLQDCVDLAKFVIETTVSAQALSLTVRGVGGPIEVAYVTQTDGLQWVQRKALRGGATFPDQVKQ